MRARNAQFHWKIALWKALQSYIVYFAIHPYLAGSRNLKSCDTSARLFIVPQSYTNS